MATIRSGVTASLGFASWTVDVLSTSSSPEDSKQGKPKMICQGDDEHAHPVSLINTAYKCPVCERTGKQADFGKGVPNGDGTFSIVTADDLARGDATDDTKLRMKFLPHYAEDVDRLVPNGKHYVLSPKGNPDTYAVMASAYTDRDDIALCTVWAARSVNSLFRLIEQDGLLFLQGLAWPQDVQAMPTAPELPESDAAYVPQVQMLFDAAVTKIEPETYIDQRREVLAEIVAEAEKVAGTEQVAEKKTATKTVLSLADQLAASLAEAAPKKAAPKTATGKKSTPKKSAAKKSGPPVNGLKSLLP